jgi:hypothetical protein
MDDEKEKDLEQTNNLSLEEKIAHSFIIPARNPQRVFTMPKGKISEGKQLSEILIEERRSGRCTCAFASWCASNPSLQLS